LTSIPPQAPAARIPIIPTRALLLISGSGFDNPITGFEPDYSMFQVKMVASSVPGKDRMAGFEQGLIEGHIRGA
jgi:hypothetical protein